MRARTRRNTGAALAGIAVIGGLAACTSDAADSTTGSTSDSSATDESTTGGTDASSTATYADGEYTAEGDYTTPGGQESVTVTVMLEDNVVTSLEVEGSGGSPNTQRYQGEFIDNIQSEVVGQDIDDLSVSKVAGSSLTSGGFNAAIETIKSDASS
ncbi:FMN-binding protein [Labedella endophytica]|uniref:FMN-binding protein n=1 Tax=Labedella endophytica TaxID=1523160 RepID=A0A433JSK0_9MICO|nr:hypothetical protein [Labedella endophytica]RUR01283.1 hypothetical protein ELQ94_07170 [Labedella endophytica]